MVTASVPSADVSGNSCPLPPRCRANRSNGDYVSLGIASSLLNLSDSTTRRLVDSGVVASITLPSGHRRVSRRSISAFLHEEGGVWTEDETTNGKIPVALVARVSSNAQSKGISKGSQQNDLARQQQRLRDFAKEKWGDSRIQVIAQPTEGERVIELEARYSPEEQVQDWLNRLEKDSFPVEQAAATLIRLVVFVGLLSHDHDMITPIVLAKDQMKYDLAKAPDERKWLEDRAARRAGRGFEVCKQLEIDRATSPHWRNPHPCLFWTGPGRTVPIIKIRSGAIIQRVSMADVPTGYLGPEKEDELNDLDEKTPRETISSSRRFDIMSRDRFSCQLCGATKKHGAVLHIDHKIPLAKGGSNENDNLWTLCDRCNLGKSDKDLPQE
jgi:hypothetical protein